jgi:hypothetical protein
VECCCNIALPAKIDSNETHSAKVTFNSAVNANAQANDDASALGSGVPAAAASSMPSADSDGKVDSQSDSSQTSTTMQGQARAIVCTKFIFEWEVVGYRDKVAGRLIVSGQVVGDFSALGPKGRVILSKLEVLDTTVPIPVRTATATGFFQDVCGDRATASITLTRSGM